LLQRAHGTLLTFLRMTRPHIVALALVALALSFLLPSLWLSDDAAITLRTVLNFVEGYGARFNIDERVQAYTHPLWFLLISAATVIFGNVFFATWTVAVAATSATIWLFATRVARTATQAIAGVALLFLSKPLFDFSISGLENPLSHLLVCIALIRAALIAIEEKTHPKSFGVTFFVLGLTYLSRPDLPLLFAPLALWLMFRPGISSRTRITAIVLGALPIVLWTTVSVVYYGFPFPNTAYAKLLIDIPATERIAQGGLYLWDSFNRDPLTLIVIGAAVVATIKRRTGFEFACALGIVAYVVYLCLIGGDFMSGRLLSAPFVVSLFLLIRQSHMWSRKLIAFALILLSPVNVYAHRTHGLFVYMNPNQFTNGIADERRYLHYLALRKADPKLFALSDWRIGERTYLVACGGLGLLGLQFGPGTHIVDQCALSEPMLARIPPKSDKYWRPGHFFRQLPTDYLTALRTPTTGLPDPTLHRLYDAISNVVRAPLMDRSRWRDIAALNLGKLALLEDTLRRYREENIARTRITPRMLIDEIANNNPCAPWDAKGHLYFENEAEIMLNQPISITSINVSYDRSDEYRLLYWHENAWHLFATVPSQPAKSFADCSMVSAQIALSYGTPLIERIKVTGIGDSMYSISKVRINAP
jgi:arabinofuranosyltransferase